MPIHLRVKSFVKTSQPVLVIFAYHFNKLNAWQIEEAERLEKEAKERENESKGKELQV